MKKLKWTKKMFQEDEADDITVWTAQVKTVGWEFTIEQTFNGNYDPYLWYGQGDDIRLLPTGRYCKSLDDAKKVCNDWLHNLIVNINKWY